MSKSAPILSIADEFLVSDNSDSGENMTYMAGTEDDDMRHSFNDVVQHDDDFYLGGQRIVFSAGNGHPIMEAQWSQLLCEVIRLEYRDDAAFGKIAGSDSDEDDREDATINSVYTELQRMGKTVM